MMSDFSDFDQLGKQEARQQMIGGPASLGPAWTRGEIEKPAGSKDMGGWTATVYTVEQQNRLGIDEFGGEIGFTPKPGRKPLQMGRRTGGQQTLGPEWTRNKIEAPQGEKLMPGGWTASVYTPEQQSRLGVDENGHKLSESLASLNPFSGSLESVGPSYTLGKMEKPHGQRTVNGYTEAYYTGDQQRRLGVDQYGKKRQTTQTLGPAYTRNQMEAPKGVKTVSGGYQEKYYTREQQVRLNVDKHGRKREAVKNLMAAPPKWITGEIEAPRGVKDMGSWNKRVYDAEQQKRLNIDEDGNKVVKAKQKQAISRQASFGEFDPLAPQKGGLKRQLSAKGMNLFQNAVDGSEINFNDFGSTESDGTRSDDDESYSIARQNTYEKNIAERKALKEYRSWEKELKTELPKGFKRDEEGNLMGSILERVSSKMVKRKWVPRDIVIEKDRILLLKRGDKKGKMNLVDIDEYTLVSDIETKIHQGDDGANAKYCRIKVTNKPPWGQKESLLCQLGVLAVNVDTLKFVRQELMHIL